MPFVDPKLNKALKDAWKSAPRRVKRTTSKKLRKAFYLHDKMNRQMNEAIRHDTI